MPDDSYKFQLQALEALDRRVRRRLVTPGSIVTVKSRKMEKRLQGTVVRVLPHVPWIYVSFPGESYERGPFTCNEYRIVELGE